MNVKMLRLFFYITCAAVLLYISGCGSSEPTYTVNLNCEDDCNGSNAIVIRMYQLRNTEKFSSTNFESLVRNPEEILADDIVPGSKFEKTMTPGEKINIDKQQYKEGAKYLGVLGDFHSPDKDAWKTIIPLDPNISHINIQIHENSLSFSLN